MARFSFWTPEGFYLGETVAADLCVAALDVGINLSDLATGRVRYEREAVSS